MIHCDGAGVRLHITTHHEDGCVAGPQRTVFKCFDTANNISLDSKTEAHHTRSSWVSLYMFVFYCGQQDTCGYMKQYLLLLLQQSVLCR